MFERTDSVQLEFLLTPCTKGCSKLNNGTLCQVKMSNALSDVVKGIPAAGNERPLVATLFHQHKLWLPCDLADGGED